MNTVFVGKARDFALKAHEGQVRKNKAQTPFSAHIEEVATLVDSANGSELEVAAAWLHDIVEDTSTTLDDLRNVFGNELAEIVDGLTDPPEFKGMGTLERKTLQAERVALKSKSVKIVKIADQISNTRTVACDPPVLWDAMKCIHYTEGARRIVSNCRGVNASLTVRFYEVHKASVQRWGAFTEG